MGYYGLRLELRVALSLLAGAVVFCLGLVLGPADGPARAAVVALCAGALASGLAGFTFPGWPLFSAAPAFLAGGFIHGRSLSGAQWLDQTLLVVVATVVWALAWPLARAGMEQLVGASFEEAHLPPADEVRLVPGVVCLCAVAAALALVFLWAFPVGMAVAFPAAALVSVWALASLPRMDPMWPAAGALFSLPAAYCLAVHVLPRWARFTTQPGFPTPTALRYPFDLAYLPPPDPWMLAGLVLAGSMLSYWLHLLYRLGKKCPA